MMMSFSPSAALEGQSVLLTGGLGFAGRVIAEQLLRLTGVRRLYLLVRDKRGKSADERVAELLASPLFHLVPPADRACVTAVRGDLLAPGLGLGRGDAAQLRAEVTVVIHCAANIELDAEVHKTLRTNYVGTEALLALAAGMPRLSALVHVSTYYVNNHAPRGSTVAEAMYPLPLRLGGGAELDHAAFVAALLAMPPVEADAAAACVMEDAGFTSTYALGKHLAERLVAAAPLPRGAARAIVRPSLIASVAGAPYPGIRAGLHALPAGIAYAADAVMDLVPADVVAALVIAAAGAAASGAGPAPRVAAGGGAGGLVIYHATSAQSHPLTIERCYAAMREFWSANAPPFRLPGSRYVTMRPGHVPSQAAIEAARAGVARKVSAVCRLLALARCRRAARALSTGFRAFGTFNSIAYGKSFVCAVDNARGLAAALARGRGGALAPGVGARGDGLGDLRVHLPGGRAAAAVRRHQAQRRARAAPPVCRAEPRARPAAEAGHAAAKARGLPTAGGAAAPVIRRRGCWPVASCFGGARAARASASGCSLADSAASAASVADVRAIVVEAPDAPSGGAA
ncbi:fatty acyl-CoA reductase [Scenedesmus sp. PABB004]|nr:fatty acyl-CoA reductase [Scenedesmus sp. PABB004]